MGNFVEAAVASAVSHCKFRIYHHHMKILLTGANGQLGRELKTVLDRRFPGCTTAVDKEDLDLTDAEAVERFLTGAEFTHVVNTAAYTAVDRAEEEKSQCTAVNTDAVCNIARLADDLSLHIIHLSTDYVFDGNAHMPYREGDKVLPLNHYGSTKRKSETALLGLAPGSIIVRTSWLYSPLPGAKNFVKTILSLADDRTAWPLKIVADQIGTPTYAVDLAETIADILGARQWVPGIYHYSDEGVASWYDFAKAILRNAGREDVPVVPIKTADLPRPAERPIYAVLDKSLIKATYGITIPYWEESLQRAMQRLQSPR